MTQIALSPFDRIPTDKNFTVGATKYGAIQQNGMYEEWLVDTGKQSPENLDNKLPVQMGKFTEPLNKRWYTQQTGIKFLDLSSWEKQWRDKPEIEFQHREHNWLMVHPDAAYVDFDKNEMVLVDFKHTNMQNFSGGFLRTQFIERYEPQLQMQMFAASSALGIDVNRAEMSVLYGNAQWDIIEFTAQPERQIEILKTLQQYVHFVVNDIEPPHDAIPEITKQTVTPSQIYDWDESNEENIDSNSAREWQVLREQYLKTKTDYDAHNEVKKLAKQLMPDDARVAGCNKLTMERNKRGIVFKEQRKKVRHG